MIGNVLANRYASAAMRDIWSAESKIIAERRLWLAVLAAQNDLGVDLGGDDPASVVAAYEGVVDQVDLASIAARSGSPARRPGPDREFTHWPIRARTQGRTSRD